VCSAIYVSYTVYNIQLKFHLPEMSVKEAISMTCLFSNAVEIVGNINFCRTENA